MEGFLRHNSEERGLEKTLPLVYGFSIAAIGLAWVLLIGMAFLKPESNRTHRMLYFLFGFAVPAFCTAGGTAAFLTKDDAVLLAQNQYLRRNDHLYDLSQRAQFNKTERERHYSQLNLQAQASAGKLSSVLGLLGQQQQQQQLGTQQFGANLNAYSNPPVKRDRPALTPHPGLEVVQPQTQSNESNTPPAAAAPAYTQTPQASLGLPPQKNHTSLPELIALSTVTLLLVAGTRVGKTVLLKAAIHYLLARRPDTLFFISACKLNDWFGLEKVSTPEFGPHHSISNGTDIEGIVSQVSNAFTIYDYRAKNLSEEEQKKSAPVICILDDWLTQAGILKSTNSKSFNVVMTMLMSIANNGAGCNVTLWVTAQSMNLKSFGFLDSGTRSSLNIVALGRVAYNPFSKTTEGNYKAIEFVLRNKNQLFTPDEVNALWASYNSLRQRRDVNGSYSIAPLAFIAMGGGLRFEELEDYTTVIEASKKNKPKSAIAQAIDLEKEPLSEGDSSSDEIPEKFWELVVKLEDEILQKGVVDDGLTPSNVMTQCSAAVQIRQDPEIKHLISKEFVETVFKRLAEQGDGRIEQRENRGVQYLRFWSI